MPDADAGCDAEAVADGAVKFAGPTAAPATSNSAAGGDDARLDAARASRAARLALALSKKLCALEDVDSAIAAAGGL